MYILLIYLRARTHTEPAEKICNAFPASNRTIEISSRAVAQSMCLQLGDIERRNGGEQGSMVSKLITANGTAITVNSLIVRIISFIARDDLMLSPPGISKVPITCITFIVFFNMSFPLGTCKTI